MNFWEPIFKKSSEYQPQVVLGSCLLNPEADFIRNLCNLCQTGGFVGYSFPNVSLLPISRNIVVKHAYANNPDFTHLVFIDDDMCNFSLNNIARLVLSDQPVVSALCCHRTPPYRLVANIDSHNVLEYIEKGLFIEVNHVGMACTVIKREVLDATQENTPDGPIWFTTDREPRDSFEIEASDFIKLNKDRKDTNKLILEAIILGQQSHLNSQLLGEDIAFSKKVSKLGFKLWVDCGSPIGHIGQKVCDYEDSTYEKEQPELSVVMPD